MAILTGLIVVTVATGLALFVNDQFHMGGYIDETELAPLPRPDIEATEERELVGAGNR